VVTLFEGVDRIIIEVARALLPLLLFFGVFQALYLCGALGA